MKNKNTDFTFRFFGLTGMVMMLNLFIIPKGFTEFGAGLTIPVPGGRLSAGVSFRRNQDQVQPDQNRQSPNNNQGGTVENISLQGRDYNSFLKSNGEWRCDDLDQGLAAVIAKEFQLSGKGLEELLDELPLTEEQKTLLRSNKIPGVDGGEVISAPRMLAMVMKNRSDFTSEKIMRAFYQGKTDDLKSNYLSLLPGGSSGQTEDYVTRMLGVLKTYYDYNEDDSSNIFTDAVNDLGDTIAVEVNGRTQEPIFQFNDNDRFILKELITWQGANPTRYTDGYQHSIFRDIITSLDSRIIRPDGEGLRYNISSADEDTRAGMREVFKRQLKQDMIRNAQRLRELSTLFYEDNPGGLNTESATREFSHKIHGLMSNFKDAMIACSTQTNNINRCVANLEFAEDVEPGNEIGSTITGINNILGFFAERDHNSAAGRGFQTLTRPFAHFVRIESDPVCVTPEEGGNRIPTLRFRGGLRNLPRGNNEWDLNCTGQDTTGVERTFSFDITELYGDTQRPDQEGNLPDLNLQLRSISYQDYQDLSERNSQDRALAEFKASFAPAFAKREGTNLDDPLRIFYKDGNEIKIGPQTSENLRNQASLLDVINAENSEDLIGEIDLTAFSQLNGNANCSWGSAWGNELEDFQLQCNGQGGGDTDIPEPPRRRPTGQNPDRCSGENPPADCTPLNLDTEDPNICDADHPEYDASTCETSNPETNGPPSTDDTNCPGGTCDETPLGRDEDIDGPELVDDDLERPGPIRLDDGSGDGEIFPDSDNNALCEIPSDSESEGVFKAGSDRVSVNVVSIPSNTPETTETPVAPEKYFHYVAKRTLGFDPSGEGNVGFTIKMDDTECRVEVNHETLNAGSTFNDVFNEREETGNCVAIAYENEGSFELRVHYRIPIESDEPENDTSEVPTPSEAPLVSMEIEDVKIAVVEGETSEDQEISCTYNLGSPVEEPDTEDPAENDGTLACSSQGVMGEGFDYNQFQGYGAENSYTIVWIDAGSTALGTITGSEATAESINGYMNTNRKLLASTRQVEPCENGNPVCVVADPRERPGTTPVPVMVKAVGEGNEARLEVHPDYVSSLQGLSECSSRLPTGQRQNLNQQSGGINLRPLYQRRGVDLGIIPLQGVF